MEYIDPMTLEIALSNVPYNVNVYFESLHEPFSAFVIVTVHKIYEIINKNVII